jgi:hypothetical protein
MAETDLQPNDAEAKVTDPAETPKAHRAFDRLKRELSDDELASPGVHKLLLETLARAEDELSTLRAFRDKFHSADKGKGILEEKLKVRRASEAVSMGSLAVGSAALGYAPILTSTAYGGWVAVAFGTVLIGVGIYAKVVSLK